MFPEHKICYNLFSMDGIRYSMLHSGIFKDTDGRGFDSIYGIKVRSILMV